MNQTTNNFVQGHPHTAVFGITGGGKTTLIKRMIRDSKRLAVWDVMEDIAEPGKGRAAIKPVDGAGMLTAFKRAYSGNRNMRIAYQPPLKNRQQLFEKFCENIIRLQGMHSETRPLWLDVVIDEIDSVFPPNTVRDHPFSDLVRRGRHYGVRLIGGTQFPTTVNPDFRRNCAVSYLFPLGSEGKNFVQSNYRNREAAEIMPTLPNHHAVVIETGKHEPWIYQNPPLKKP